MAVGINGGLALNKSRLYITLNRSSEWQRGLLCGLTIAGGAVKSAEGAAECAIITGSADSTERGFLWRSAEIFANVSENTIMRVSAYAADTTFVTIGDKTVDLDELLTDGALSEKGRLELVLPLFKPLVTNCFDAPINLKGRYIWIKLDFMSLDRKAIELSKIKLLLRSDSMMQYLPETYLSSDGEVGFMSRFMSMFESIFFDMDGRIQSARDSIDYRVADGDMLRYLADWIMTDDAAYLDISQLREKIRSTAQEYKTIGTKQGLSGWIMREYGFEPVIIEYFDLKKMISEGKDCELYKRIFGSNPYKFFVLIPENTFADTHAANIFTQKLKSRIPAYTEAEVIVLKKNIVLDNNTYLDVNSIVNGYSSAQTEFGSVVGDIILGGSSDEQ